MENNNNGAKELASTFEQREGVKNNLGETPEEAKKRIEYSNKKIELKLKDIGDEDPSKIKKRFDKENSHFAKYQKLKMPDGSEVREDKLKQMDTSDFLKMDSVARLSIVTKGEGIIEQGDLEGKEITMNFPENDKMFLNIGLEDLLDKNVGVVTVNGKDYTRDSLTGAFKDKNGNRIAVYNGDKVKIKKTREKEDFDKLNKQTKEEYEKIIKSQGIDEEKDDHKIGLVQECVEKGLKEKEVAMILKGDFEGLSKISPKSRQKEIMKNLIHLRDKGLLQNQELIDQVNNFDDEKVERRQIERNKIEGKEINKIHLNSKGEIINGSISQGGYGGDTYSSKNVIGENVDTSAIDAQTKALKKVENVEADKQLLEGKGLSDKNKKLIFERIPKDWFEVAIKLANKEKKEKGKDLDPNKPIALASVSKKVGLISYPDGRSEQVKIITAQKGRTDMLDTVTHFNGAIIKGKGIDASVGQHSKTVLGASVQSPEGGANGGKWWHGVRDGRIPGGKTWGCVGVKQDIAMRLARSVQQHGGGYGYEVS